MKRETGLTVAAIALAISTLGVRAQDVPTTSHINTFKLTALNGNTLLFSPAQSKATVVTFISTRCPISNAFNSRINELYDEFARRVQFLVVDSNANESVEEVRHHAENVGYDFPVYEDSDNVVADMLAARSTPEAFVVSQAGTICYRGNIEDAVNPERTKIRPLRMALEAVLAGNKVPIPETHSLGCSIRRVRNKTTL